MLSYAVLTPARDEADNLPRLAAALAAQTVLPLRWLIVDNGSTDATPAVIDAFTAEHPWSRLLRMPGERVPKREAAIARALAAGVDALDVRTDLVVKVDADIDFDEDYFERLIARFEQDPQLAIASGSALERENGQWRQRFGTGFTVWGAARTWRRDVLDELLPLDERVGWDGIDVILANMRGYRTATFLDLHFRHHRREGERDGTVAAYVAEGRLAHYLGYRPSYVVLRAAMHGRRRSAGLTMLWGYLDDVRRRAPAYADRDARAFMREQQRLRHVLRRAREARGA